VTAISAHLTEASDNEMHAQEPTLTNWNGEIIGAAAWDRQLKQRRLKDTVMPERVWLSTTTTSSFQP
jgi:hypothetical protein